MLVIGPRVENDRALLRAVAIMARPTDGPWMPPRPEPGEEELWWHLARPTCILSDRDTDHGLRTLREWFRRQIARKIEKGPLIDSFQELFRGQDIAPPPSCVPTRS